MFFLHMTEDKVVHYNPTPPPIYYSVTIKHKGQVGEGRVQKMCCSTAQGWWSNPCFYFELSNEQTTFAEKT